MYKKCTKSCSNRPQKTCLNPLFRCLPSPLNTHQLREFQYPDLIWKELCGQMTYLVAEMGVTRANCHKSWRLFAAIPASVPERLAQWALRSLNVSLSVQKMTFPLLSDMLQRRERYGFWSVFAHVGHHAAILCEDVLA